MTVWLGLLACGEYHHWPDPDTTFPYGAEAAPAEFTYQDIRWEAGGHDSTDPAFIGLYLQKALLHRPGATTELREHFNTLQVPADPGELQLTFAGDIMYRVQDNWSRYAEPTAGLFATADLRIGNLETPTSDAHSIEPRAHGLYAFNAPSAMLDSLPFDALQVTNNHALDVGDEGLQNTLDAIADHGMLAYGTGATQVMERQGQRIALHAYTWGMNDGRTTEAFDLHVVNFGDVGETDLSRVQADLLAVEADLHVVTLHWGFEYEYYPEPHFMILARELITAGADVIIGQGPHVVQPAELCFVNHPEVVPGIGTCSVRTEDGRPRRAAVMYSLGDFGTDIPTLPTRVGILAHVALDDQGVTGVRWSGVSSVTEGGTAWIRPLDAMLDDPRHAEENNRLTGHLNLSRD